MESNKSQAPPPAPTSPPVPSPSPTPAPSPTLMDRCAYADFPVDPAILYEFPDYRQTMVFGLQLADDYIVGRVDWDGCIVSAFIWDAGDGDGIAGRWVAE